MTSPITEPPMDETANSTATNTSPPVGGASTEETETAEVPGPPTDASASPEATPDDASELSVEETPDHGALSVPEEQWSAGSDAAHEHMLTRGSRVDMRIGRNYGLAVGQWYEAIQRYSGAELTKEWIAGELKDYVQIANETELIDLLRDTRVLVLHAKEPGSGRWTATLRLLSKFGDPQLTIRRIKRETSASFAISGLRGHRNTGWILDLRDPDESISANGDLGHELLQIGDLDADESLLVVLVGTGLWERIGRGAEKLARTVEFPGPLKLCSALLDSSKVTKADAWAEKFWQGVEPSSSAKIFTWSRVFASSYREFETKNGRSPLPDVEKDVEEIAKIVRSAASGWMDALTAWHTEPGRTSYDRNYLLLAAVYDGAPIEFVHRKIASLAETLGEKGEQAEPLEGQQGPGLHEAYNLMRLRARARIELGDRKLRISQASTFRDLLREDPTLALAYILLETPEKIGSLDSGKIIKAVGEQVAAYSPGSTWVKTAQLLEKTFGELPNDEKQAMIDRICKVMMEFGERPTAEHLQETYKWQ